MRLGLYDAKLKDNSLIKKFINQNLIKERHRHRYEVNIAYKEKFEKNGMIFSGLSPDNKLTWDNWTKKSPMVHWCSISSWI